jgi:DNA polymerase III subunit gamma/tau
LEEPPAHVVFMMATTELHKVPDTILSRCQQFEFRHIPVDKIFKRLREIAEAEKVNIQDEALREVARAGNGSLRDAQSAFDQVISFSGEEISEQDVLQSLGLVSAKILGQAIKAIVEQDTSALLKVVDELDSSGHDLRYFTRELMTYVRHLLVLKSGITNSNVLGISATEVEELKRFAIKFSEEDLVRIFHLLTELEKQIKDSPQPRFQLEIGLVKVAQMTRLRALDEVIRRLEELQAKLSNGNFSAPDAAPAAAKPKPASSACPDQLRLQRIIKQDAVAPAVADVFEEPPGFSDAFDQSSFAPPAPDFAREPVRSPVVETTPVVRPKIQPGAEIGAIKAELEKRRKTLIVMALEEASVTYEHDHLMATFASENTFSKRLRESASLFREMGENLFGHPLRVTVKISGEEVATPAQAAKQAREKLLESVKNNPAVQALLETFRGEIIDVQEPAS